MDMKTKMTKFELTLLNIDLAPMIQDCLKAFPKQSCDLNLSNMFTWGSLYKLQYFIWNNAYVIYNPRYHYIAFPFCKNFDAEQLAALVKEFRTVDDKVEMILFPAEWIQSHPDAVKYFRFRTHDAWSDYVYLAEKLYTLSGKKLAKKKNLIAQFRKLHPKYTVESIQKEDMTDILEHFQKWQQDRNIKDINLTMECRAIKNAFKYWDKLPLGGLKILIDNEIVAWSIFSPQTDYMATIHFEKFDPAIKGCAQLINWETAKYLKDRYLYINREQDMGIEGLRQAKRSYEPEFMVAFTTSRLK